MRKELPLQHCFDEGRVAAIDGSEEASCPYPAHTIEYETWRESLSSLIEDN